MNVSRNNIDAPDDRNDDSNGQSNRPRRVGTTIAAVVICATMSATLLGGCQRTADIELSQKFQAAQQAFDDSRTPEDFAKAAALYQEIIDQGCVSGAVLYDQGNAWMRAGQPGRAIAAYRRALRYLPRDPYLNHNLAIARGNAAEPRRPVIETVMFWQNWLSYPEKFYLAAAAALAAFAFATAGLFVARRTMKRIAWAGLTLTAVLALSVAYDWNRFDNVAHGVIVAPEVVARKGNAVSYEPAFNDELTEGTEFRVVERRGDWLLIRLPGDGEGWIESKAAVVY